MSGRRSKAMRVVIAASRGPYRAVARRLAAKGRSVTFVQKKERLSARLLDRLEPRYVFLPHWSYIVPPEIYERHECVVFHMTDLPFGRGGSPLQNLIVRGHRRTKISALRCGAVLDGGPIYLKRPLSLEGTAAEILARAAGVIKGMMAWILRHQPEPKPQRGKVTTFRRRTPAESDLRAVRSPDQAYDFIRMLDGEGYPRAFLETESVRLEFYSAVRRKDAVEAKVIVTRRKR